VRRVLKKTFNPWVVVFIGTAIFHFTRNSIIDAIIFTLASIVILTQVFGFTDIGLKTQPTFSTFWISVVVGVAAWILYFSPRHGIENVLTLLAFIPLGLVLVVYVDGRSDGPLPAPVKRSRLVWGLWAFFFTIAELVSFVYGYFHPNTDDLPTISAVMDPILDQPLGRAIFVAIWLAFGVFMFGVRRK
jgi:hypothetical protein